MLYLSSKNMKTILKVIGGIVGTIILLVVAAVIAINTDFVQNKLLHYATGKLSEKLQTKVEADSISINFFKFTLDLHGVDIDLPSKKTDLQVGVKTLRLRGNFIAVNGFHFKTDNHKPRKNEGKPKRGWFDAGHLDFTGDLELHLRELTENAVAVSITKGCAVDSISGFNIKDLRMDLTSDLKQLYVHDAVIQQENTIINIPAATIQLPSKKKGIPLTYETTEPLTANVILQDISRLFTPALAQFTMPLKLSAMVSGNDSAMAYRDIVVNTYDEKLRINASGGIEHLKEKYLLNIGFHIDQMTAENSIIHQIIDQFVVKKFMMSSLSKLGDVRYTGDVSILRKREVFAGQLSTAAGDIEITSLMLNDSTKYLSGTVGTGNLDLGKAIDMPEIGRIIADATFEFDISKERTAQMRKERGGKLPIGTVNAQVAEANYNKIKVKNVYVDIESDGAEAKGQLQIANKILNGNFNFTFTDTNAMQKMKVKPALKINLPKIKLFSKKDKKKK